MREQRNRYKGGPPRPWLRLELLARDGAVCQAEFLADTGCPHGLVLGPELFDRLVVTYTRAVPTNFGPMDGGWVRLYTRGLGLVEFIEAEAASDWSGPPPAATGTSSALSASRSCG